MGDVGSLFLGFLFAALPLAAPREEVGPAVFVAGMAMWPFLSDGAYTLVRRLLRGERIWEAHRSHLYQRLVGAGWSHGRVTGSVMTAGAVIAALAVATTLRGWVEAQRAVVVLALVSFLVYIDVATGAERKDRISGGR